MKKMTLKFNGFKAKRNFHTMLNFALFQKYEMYENKYRTKICDFAVFKKKSQYGKLTSNMVLFMSPGSPCISSSNSMLATLLMLYEHMLVLFLVSGRATRRSVDS